MNSGTQFFTQTRGAGGGGGRQSYKGWVASEMTSGHVWFFWQLVFLPVLALLKFSPQNSSAND